MRIQTGMSSSVTKPVTKTWYNTKTDLSLCTFQFACGEQNTIETNIYIYIITI